jgi:regulator of protease activity HflC (stomatin/prohibitin superfamily)
MNTTSKRAEYVALTGLIFSVLFYITVTIFGFLTRSLAVAGFGWFILAGLFVWLVLLFAFHLRSLAEQEKLDVAQLAASNQGETIFQGGADRQALLHVAGQRLKAFEKWFMPSFSILIAVYEIAIGLYLFYRVQAEDFVAGQVVNPQLAAIIMVMVAFLSFLISRYATGLSGEKKWQLLRTGGSYMLVVALLSLLLAISLALSQWKIEVGLNILRWVSPVLLVVMGGEICLNTVFDIYRPRLAGQEVRLALDSRLLAIINEPGGLLHTFASAIDYQFGFKVSQTWFYQLIVRAAVPMFLFFLAVLSLLSCLVVVGPGQRAVIQHLGKFDADSIVGPGRHFKLPWPFDVAMIYPTDRVQLINIGFEKGDDHKDDNRPLLWGQQHYETEYNLLVATDVEQEDADQEVAPVSIVNAAVPVKYKINDLYAYVRNTIDPQERLEAICYAELSRYAASAKIETEGDDIEGAKRLSIIGAGRWAAGKQLQKSIQAKADQAKLGVEIVFVGLQGVHPPKDVADAYQKVIGSIQRRQAQILTAEGESNRILTNICGSVKKADQLYDIVQRLSDAKTDGDEEKIAAVSKELYDAVEDAEGGMFKTLAQARSYAFQRVSSAKAAGQRFAGQLEAYAASPDIYKKQYRLDMLVDALKNVRKYVVVAEEDDTEIYIINLEQKLATGLYDLEMTGDVTGQ